jgi:uncharacterized protein
MASQLFKAGAPRVFAALHLPPFLASRHPDARPPAEILEYALRNVSRAVEAGVDAVYLQDLGDTPHAIEIQSYTVAGISALGGLLRKEFPHLSFGICLMAHGAREPLAIAQAIGADFVRLKVYVGAMVKAEGIVQGCAYQAVQYRSQINAEDIAILADVYDRTGEPLGRMPLVEEARQAAVFGRADGITLTGKSVPESLDMLREVRVANLGVPLLVGGGVTPQNVAQFAPLVDGIIVSSAFKAVGGWSRQSLGEDWDGERIRSFMQALHAAVGAA